MNHIVQNRYNRYKSICFTFFVLLIVLSVISCSDSSNGGNSSIEEPTGMPAANAGQGQQVYESETVTLDGTKSQGSEASILSYQWVQLSGPNAILTGSNTATPQFTAPSVTTDSDILFELTVSDEFGRAGNDQTKVVVRYNQIPLANAGVDQTVRDSQFVSLDGSASYDNDGSIVNYQWTQISGTSVVNDPNFDVNSPQPSFTYFLCDFFYNYVNYFIGVSKSNRHNCCCKPFLLLFHRQIEASCKLSLTLKVVRILLKNSLPNEISSFNVF